mmetsp:Transcript_147556/g.471934  ORF Transcript_147556/g.471934 Transcript_147556/m.471934 type:complete len:331 (-) Transcript_147556:825-1817(-)
MEKRAQQGCTKDSKIQEDTSISMSKEVTSCQSSSDDGGLLEPAVNDLLHPPTRCCHVGRVVRIRCTQIKMMRRALHQEVVYVTLCAGLRHLAKPTMPRIQSAVRPNQSRHARAPIGEGEAAVAPREKSSIGRREGYAVESRALRCRSFKVEGVVPQHPGGEAVQGLRAGLPAPSARPGAVPGCVAGAAGALVGDAGGARQSEGHAGHGSSGLEQRTRISPPLRLHEQIACRRHRSGRQCPDGVGVVLLGQSLEGVDEEVAVPGAQGLVLTDLEHLGHLAPLCCLDEHRCGLDGIQAAGHRASVVLRDDVLEGKLSDAVGSPTCEVVVTEL